MMVDMSGIAVVGAFFILMVLGAVALVVFLAVRNQSAAPATFPERSALTSTSAHGTYFEAEGLRPSSIAR